MAKQVGFEVVALKPVCVDFLDGRTVSFRPGQRFTAALTNASVQRLLRTQEVRKLNAFEAVPAMPVKLGAPRRIQTIMQRRAEVEEARRVALAKLAASKKAAPVPEMVDLGPSQTQSIKKKPKPRGSEESRPAEDK